MVRIGAVVDGRLVSGVRGTDAAERRRERLEREVGRVAADRRLDMRSTAEFWRGSRVLTASESMNRASRA
jgi:hypothetical protein